MLSVLLVAGWISGLVLSGYSFSPLELQDRFEGGQKLYALGDYNKAIAQYELVLSTQSTRTIDVEAVNVTVDEFILPVRIAATYQLANTYNKLGLEKFERAEYLRGEGKATEAEQRQREAMEDLGTSRGYFQQIIQDEGVDQRTRVMAQYQIVQTSYQLREHERVIDEARELIRRFPNSVYETAAYYDIAWSHFELEQYEQAVESFEVVLTLSPTGARSDRALFQMAECYDKLGLYDEALVYLDRLIVRYDFSAMSEQEIIEMTTLKLKGIVKETTRELVAKAQLKRGDILGHRGEVDAALEAYAVLPEQYAAEARMVQDSHVRSAELIYEHRGAMAAVVAYKSAIESMPDEVFQGQMQLQVARLLFDEGEFSKAAEEYGIYRKAYPDVASRVGFAIDRSVFREAQSEQAFGEKVRADDPAAAAEALERAVVLYRGMLEQYPESDLVPEVVYGLGYSLQLLRKPSEAREAYGRVVREHGQHEAAPSAQLQIARIEYELGRLPQSSTAYRELVDRYGDSELVDTAHMELGITQKKQGDRDAAIASLEAVSEGWRQWPKVQLELAELYMGRGEADKAREAIKRAMGKTDDPELARQLHYVKGKTHFSLREYEGAVAELGMALRGGATGALAEGALFTRGSAYYELGNRLSSDGQAARASTMYESALGDLQELLDREPAPHIRNGAYRTVGACMIHLDRAQEAARYYREIIAATDDPQERASFQVLLTELYYDMEDFAQTIALGRQLLAAGSEDAAKGLAYRRERAYALVGNALIRQGQHSEAAGVFAEGLRRYPESSESAALAFYKGFAEFSSRDYEAAAASFSEYLSGFGNDANQVHGQYYLAHSRQALTAFDEAAAAFGELVTEYPESVYDEESHFLMGENHYNARAFDRAAAAYEDLLTRYPGGQYADTAQYALAWAYFEQENMEKGVEAMQGLVDRYPDSEYASRAQYTVGDYYYNARVYERALTAYQQVLDDHPASDEAPKARELVGELSEIQASFAYAEVMKLFDEENYQEAVAGFKELIATYPGTGTELASYCNMAMAYENLRQWDEAAATYEVAIAKAGDDPEDRDVMTFAEQHRDWIVENRL